MESLHAKQSHLLTIPQTTTPQTTPETTLSTTLSTTMSTTPSTTIAQIVVSSTTPLVETTTGFQSTTNVVASSPTTIETTKTDTVQETTVMTNKIDDGSENTFTIVMPTSENGTMSPTQLTTTSTTTLSNSIEVVTMSTEKQEINVTIDEVKCFKCFTGFFFFFNSIFLSSLQNVLYINVL